MTGLLSSYLIEPALRQARRFSSPSNDPPSLSSTNRVKSEHAYPRTDDDSEPYEMFNEDAAESSRRAEPGQIPLNDVRRSYVQDADEDEEEREQQQGPDVGHVATTERDPDVARENGLQGLLPLDDVRSNYVFDPEPLGSAEEMPVHPAAPNTAAADPSHSNIESQTLESFSSMSVDDGPSMTSNPSYGASQDLRSVGEESSSSSVRNRFNARMGNDGQSVPSRQGSTTSVTMSEHLPEDDGMNALREKMHYIQELALSTEEKAQRMHDLMTEDYRRFRSNKLKIHTTFEASNGHTNSTELLSPRLGDDAVSPQIPSPISDTGLDALLHFTDEDLKPTFQPREPLEGAVDAIPSTHADDEALVLGCSHYRRNVKVQCDDCWKWYTCRFCHDEAEDHILNRTKIRNMLCMHCGRPQKAAERCISCREITASYYCNICKLWDNDSSHSIYHCTDCGICRRGEGLGKDYIHCKRCNVCINISHAATHRCIERATECNCPICGEWMFTSSIMVVAVQCGHYMHKPCHDELMRTSFKCPICNRSAVNMELQWRKLDQAIEIQPMPSQFKETQVWIICNDCTARTCTSFHWLGNKCTVCDSYNTIQVKMINSPSDQELQAMTESREVQALREAERQLESQNATANFSTTARRQSEINLAARSRSSSAPAAEPSRFPGLPAMTAMTAMNPPVAQRPTMVTDTSPVQSGTNAYQPAHLVPVPIPPEPSSYFAPQFQPLRPTQRDSPTSPRDLHMTDSDSASTSSHASDAGGGRTLNPNAPDDVTFWGEPIGTPTLGWQLPSVPRPRMPSVPMPRMPSMPDAWPRMHMPSMPRMPSMPSMPEGWGMPRVSMPDVASMSMNVGMPQAISPSTIWAAGSPVFSGLNLPSPRFFPRRRRRGREKEDDGVVDGEGEQGDDEEGESGEESSSEDEEMDWEGDGEEDGDVDEMELFGHR